MLAPGEAIWIPSGPVHDPQREHLQFVAARSAGPPAQVMLVSLCSIRDSGGYDESTILLVGDHPCVRQPSYVNYRHTRIEGEDTVLRGIETGRFRLAERCSVEILQRICSGLDASDFAAPFAKQFLRENGL